MAVCVPLTDLYLTCRVLILLDKSYLSRFWTLMEAWCSMMTPTAQGVREGKPGEERFTVACIHNAEDDYDTPKLIHMVGDKTPHEMHMKLAKPDIVVTNARDKVQMLPRVEDTDDRVKRFFKAMAEIE